MARKVENFTVTREGRDKGRTFVLTEMPADQGERWAIRALLAFASAGGELPQGVTPQSGMAGLAEVGVLNVLGRIPEERVLPLLDEMFLCVKYLHKPGSPLQDIFPGDASQIEEIVTRMDLRAALFKLHLDFTDAVGTQTTAPLRAVGAT